jgi:hypothetical protein
LLPGKQTIANLWSINFDIFGCQLYQSVCLKSAAAIQSAARLDRVGEALSHS